MSEYVGLTAIAEAIKVFAKAYAARTAVMQNIADKDRDLEERKFKDR